MHNFEFIKSFCSKDDFRKSLTKPTCYSNGLVVASDAHCLIMFWDEEFNAKHPDVTFLYDEKNKVGVNALPVVDKFIAPYIHLKAEPIGELDLSVVKSHLDEFRKNDAKYRNKHKDCTTCDGEGLEECVCCGHRKSCTDCDGEGTVYAKSGEDGYYIYPDEVEFILNETPFGFPNLGLITDNLSLIDKTVLEIYEVEKTRFYARIKGTEYYLIVMALGKENDDKKQVKLEIKKAS